MGEARFENPPLQDAGHAVAERGFVLLDGPNGIAVSMTPDAAARTGESLIAAAQAARTQSPKDQT